MWGACPVGIDEQPFVEAVAKELNRSPRTPSPVGLWRFGRVRDGFLEQFEAMADEGGHLGVAVTNAVSAWLPSVPVSRASPLR